MLILVGRSCPILGQAQFGESGISAAWKGILRQELVPRNC